MLHMDKASILARWAEHSRELLNRQNPHNPNVFKHLPSMPVAHELDDPPRLHEVRAAILSLKDGKAAGPDCIPAELLKHGGEELQLRLLDLICECWEREEVPQAWKDSNLVYIYKRKGEKSVCGNSRGISLLATAGKVLARCMLSRLLALIVDDVIPESQCGFRRERGTTDMIFVMRQIQEKCREQHRDLYVAFIDLTKAFDTVNRNVLWTALQKAGCPGKFVAVTRALHEGMRSAVCCAGERSVEFEVNVGVRQGCVLAPVLFNIFLAMVMKLIYRRIDPPAIGVAVRHRQDGNLFNLRRLKAATKTNISVITDLQYADDAALVSHTPEGLQRCLDAVSATYSEAGLVVNTVKTEVLQQPSNPGTPSAEFRTMNTTLTNTHDFRYLGSVVTDRVDLSREIHRRIALASASFGRLSTRVFYNHDLRLTTKMAVFRAVCVSILLYGCESWTLYRAQVRKLESFYTSCLQKILGLRWWHRIPHSDIRRRLQAPPLESLLLSRQLRWLGHVVRMPHERLPRQVAYGELAVGRRSVGGQKRRYKDHIKAGLKACNIPPESLETLASNRDVYREHHKRGVNHFIIKYEEAAAARRARRHALPEPGTLPCDQCGELYRTLAGLRSHQRSHARRGGGERAGAT
jgi:hypothetical protein